MNEQNDFKNQCNDEIDQQGKSELLNQLTRQWVDESTKTNYPTTSNGLAAQSFSIRKILLARSNCFGQ